MIFHPITNEYCAFGQHANHVFTMATVAFIRTKCLKKIYCLRSILNIIKEQYRLIVPNTVLIG